MNKLLLTVMLVLSISLGMILGNSSSFAIADFDGDGCAEMAIRTCEGTVFGDGQQIPDTNGDGKIDYRTWGNLNSSSPGWVDHYNSAGPEFISIISTARRAANWHATTSSTARPANHGATAIGSVPVRSAWAWAVSTRRGCPA